MPRGRSWFVGGLTTRGSVGHGQKMPECCWWVHRGGIYSNNLKKGALPLELEFGKRKESRRKRNQIDDGTWRCVHLTQADIDPKSEKKWAVTLQRVVLNKWKVKERPGAKGLAKRRGNAFAISRSVRGFRARDWSPCPWGLEWDLFLGGRSSFFVFFLLSPRIVLQNHNSPWKK